MKKITTFLTFNDQAEVAANFYTSIFKNSKIISISQFGDAGSASKGKVMSVRFELDGQEFIALNGGPSFKFAEGISLFVNCETQQEVDEVWNKLSASGEQGPCGWLKDEFGVSWQVVPAALGRLLNDEDPAKAKRAMEAMMRMSKIDISELERAHAGHPADAAAVAL
jgi:predicted 3-demethylubiquinone-9 3-methyltransferase (glyoxalase superfamily)